MKRLTYILPDEPSPGQLAQLAVDPMWPLLGMMFAGPWLGLTWFMVNSFALGSPNRIREFAIAAATVLGSALVLLALGYASSVGWIGESAMRYALLSIVAIRLACAYGLYLSQARVCELFSHYGGKLNNGWIFLAIAVMVGTPQVRAALDQSWLRLVLL